MICSRLARLVLLSESWWKHFIENERRGFPMPFPWLPTCGQSCHVYVRWLRCCEAEQTQVPLVWRLVIVWRPGCAVTGGLPYTMNDDAYLILFDGVHHKYLVT